MDNLLLVVSNPNGYQLIRASDPEHPIDTFQNYIKDDLKLGLIIYKKSSKFGLYVANAYEDRLMHIQPDYDTIFYNLATYKIHAIKGDTLYIYDNDINSAERYYYYLRENKINYELVQQIKKNGKHKTIGENGWMYEEYKEPFTKYDLIPNCFTIGNSWSSKYYDDIHQNDSFQVYSTSLEAGFGWYDYTFDDNWLFESFDFFGGGLGIEYRLPFASPKKLRDRTGQKYNHLFLNARMECGVGIAAGNSGIGLNVHGTYSTDFTHHYIRPGIGLSFLSLQVGVEVNIPVGKEFFNSYWLNGFYFRYLFLEDLNY